MRDEANQFATPYIQRLDAVNAELMQKQSNIDNLWVELNQHKEANNRLENYLEQIRAEARSYKE
eukprot:6043125-Karenia_brevis.AAC.1